MPHLLVRTSLPVPTLFRGEYNVLPSHSVGLDDKTRIILFSAEMPYVDIGIASRNPAFGGEVAVIKPQVLIAPLLAHLLVRSLARLVAMIEVIHKRHLKVKGAILETLGLGYWTNKLVRTLSVKDGHPWLGAVAKVPIANLLVLFPLKSLSFLLEPLLFCQQPLLLSSQDHLLFCQQPLLLGLQGRLLFHESFLSSRHDRKID